MQAVLERVRSEWPPHELRNAIEDWGGRLARGELAVTGLINDVLAGQPGTQRLLLFVDQFVQP
ncbi:MAG: hypothetical protein HZB39_07730 [Planctomycetes bacterium]|nr:hypothetical protein [Planctomycetota bacterium]